MIGPYTDAAAFRQALEQRLRNAAKVAARGVLRERQVFVFERFLVRAFALPEMQLVVKGGMAIELRTQRARSTRDIDLRALGAPARFEELLAGIDQQESRDYLSFRVAPAAQPDIQADGMKYPGRRYRVQAALAGKVYGDPFGVDVAFGEPVHGEPETVRGCSDLGFIDISPPECSIYPLVTHIAEKLHAYTVPRPSPNSRVKDLPEPGPHRCARSGLCWSVRSLRCQVRSSQFSDYGTRRFCPASVGGTAREVRSSATR